MELIVVRHAKSSWEKSGQSDFDRPLNERGKTAIDLMATKVVNWDLNEALFLVSAAERTQETFSRLCKVLKIKLATVKSKNKLYLADNEQLLSCVTEISQEYNKVVIIGHNPGLTYFVEYLSGIDFGNLPTAAMVKLNFVVNKWDMVGKDTAIVKEYLYPKMFS